MWPCANQRYWFIAASMLTDLMFLILFAPSRCDRGHGVCGCGPARCRRPGDPHCNVTAAGIMWPRRSAPFAGCHRSTPPTGGGHVASERRTKCTATLAHDWQLHLLVVARGLKQSKFKNHSCPDKNIVVSSIKTEITNQLRETETFITVEKNKTKTETHHLVACLVTWFGTLKTVTSYSTDQSAGNSLVMSQEGERGVRTGSRLRLSDLWWRHLPRMLCWEGEGFNPGCVWLKHHGRSVKFLMPPSPSVCLTFSGLGGGVRGHWTADWRWLVPGVHRGRSFYIAAVSIWTYSCRTPACNSSHNYRYFSDGAKQHGPECPGYWSYWGYDVSMHAEKPGYSNPWIHEKY